MGILRLERTIPLAACVYEIIWFMILFAPYQHRDEALLPALAAVPGGEVKGQCYKATLRFDYVPRSARHSAQRE